MPRPGPRPYDCVRKAWHSDRHQPIRGSLIQEIFRVANEIHSFATKKNKEWQEKLPVVVLKAEEIIYSKANSEEEYMDLKTLWERTNDAINTIIRREESTETGNLLQPCIEAALNLGCTPRRASRSQRNMHPRCYLTSSSQDPSSFPPGIVHSSIHAAQTVNVIPSCSNFVKPAIISPINMSSESRNLVCQNNNVPCNKILFATDNMPLASQNRCPMESYPAGSVFPLYYGNFPKPQCGNGILSKPVSSCKRPVEVNVVQNIISCNKDSTAKVNQMDAHENVCDLSLRLGFLSSHLPSAENGQTAAATDINNCCAREREKFDGQMQQKDRVPCFTSRVDVDDPLDLCAIRLSEQMNLDVTVKRRKMVRGHLMDDSEICRQPKLQCTQVTSRLESAGS